jgi:hypothetical protein
MLELVRRDRPVSLHGVSLSLGAVGELDQKYLKAQKELIHLIDPFLVSDHLCWTGLSNKNLHNLLPLPYNHEALAHVVSRIQKVQDFLGREIAVENLSAYVEIKEGDFTEWEFLVEVAKRSGCKLLLDINNIYVNSVNHQFDPKTYLNAIPENLVAEIHLAGHTDTGEFLFDTHSKPVCSEVWELFKSKSLEFSHSVPVLVEWDEDIPPYQRVVEEAQKAKYYWEHARGI